MRLNRIKIMFALCAVVLLLSSCGLGGGPQETEVPTPEPTATPRPIVNFTMFTAQDPGTDTNIWDTPVGQKIMELTHVYVDVQYLGSESLQSRIATMAASGDLPDFIMAGEETRTLSDAGLLVDLEGYVAESPSVERRYRNASFEGQKATYGGVYTVPTTPFEDDALYPDIGFYISYDVLAFNKFPQITTMTQYAAAIQNYMDENPKFNDEKNIALLVPTSEGKSELFYNTAIAMVEGKADDGLMLVDDSSGVGRMLAMNNDVKEYLRMYFSLWREGYMDADFFTMSDEEYLEKLASGRVLACFDTREHIEGAMETLVAGGMQERTFMACPIVIEGVTNEYYSGHYNMDYAGISITTACRDPELAFAFLERLCADDIQKLMQWGIEGEDYTYDSDGVMTMDDAQFAAFLDEGQRVQRGIGVFSSFPQAERTQDTYYGQFDDRNWVNPLLQTRYLQTFYTDFERQTLKNMGMESFTEGFAKPNIPTHDTGGEISGRMESNESFAQTAQSVQEIMIKYYPELVKSKDHNVFDTNWSKYREELTALNEAISQYEAEFNRLLLESRVYYGAQ